MTSNWLHSQPPAKLNLFLEILARRPDGYHELDTVMVAIDWRDELRLRRVERSGITLNCRWLDREEGIGPPEIPTDERNLVHRALVSFQEAFGIDGGFEVELGKRIPIGAGMGGASSDAASTLMLAAAACRTELSANVRSVSLISDLAARLGSDVPFFLGNEMHANSAIAPVQAAHATGRGEKLEHFFLPRPLHAVVIYPHELLSTADVFAAVKVPQNPHSSTELIATMRSSDERISRSEIHNRLQEPAHGLSRRIPQALEYLRQVQLTDCLMTGSGSACFALADSADHARETAERLRHRAKGFAIVRDVQSCDIPGETPWRLPRSASS